MFLRHIVLLVASNCAHSCQKCLNRVGDISVLPGVLDVAVHEVSLEYPQGFDTLDPKEAKALLGELVS